MKMRCGISVALLLFTATLAYAQDFRDVSWRYYRPGNTGIQGDYCEAIWIGPDNDPWIGGYDPGFEEGGSPGSSRRRTAGSTSPTSTTRSSGIRM